MLKMEVNSKVTKQMQNVLTKIDVFPNRIAAAQDRAILNSINEIVSELVRTHKAAKHLIFRMERVGRLGSKLHIEPPSPSDKDAYYAALIFMKGRKGGRIIRGKNGGLMKLRKESVAKGYPPFLRQAKLGPVTSKSGIIKKTSRDIVIRNIKKSLTDYGFGAKGGANVTEDIRRPRGSK